MNSKNMKKHLNNKMKDWWDSITDEQVRKLIKNNTIVTGGAMVSLLTGEKVDDYDVYLRTKEACVAIAKYYMEQWNKTHPTEKQVQLRVEDDKTEQKKVIDNPDLPFSDENSKTIPVKIPGRVKLFIRSEGVVGENKEKNRKWKNNAHCTCSWTSWDNEVQLPVKALECIINKEMYYIGSRYPLCSIIRTRKYLERGYHINAGQYVKMAFQLNELNLHDIETLEDQLTGVDSGYFMMMIEALRKKADENGEAQVDKSYVFELINRMF